MESDTQTRPLLVYDGDCKFCRTWIGRWKELTGDSVEYGPYQELGGRFPHIPREQFASAVQLISEDGTVHSGARAALRALSYNRDRRWMYWVYERIPGMARISELCYRVIARHRDAAYKVTRLFWGKDVV